MPQQRVTMPDGNLECLEESQATYNSLINLDEVQRIMDSNPDDAFGIMCQSAERLEIERHIQI